MTPRDPRIDILRAAIEAVALDAGRQVHEIHELAERYVEDTARAALHDFAQRAGLYMPWVRPDPTASAVALLMAVRALPELREPLGMAAAPALAPAPTASIEAPRSEPPPSVTLKEPEVPFADSGVIDANHFAEAEEADTDEDAGKVPVPILFPHLRVATQERGALIVVGGRRLSPDRLRWLKRCVERIDWIIVENGHERAVEPVSARLRQGNAAGLILLNGSISHKASNVVMKAAKDGSVPIEYADRGSYVRFTNALKGLEEGWANVHATVRSTTSPR